MREEEALFTLYKRGWQANIVPRRAAGWWAIVAWLMLLAPFTVAFVVYVIAKPNQPQLIAAISLYLLALALWTIGFIQWCRAHSAVVDLGKTQFAKPQQDDPLSPRPWFAARRFGFGAGLPIAWQGWALLAAWLALLAGIGMLDKSGNDTARTAAFALLLAGSATFMTLVARRTRDGRRRRWGKDDRK
ncbi:MAG: hypothetical protein ACKOPM_08220 [Novosphingobium sp.]